MNEFVKFDAGTEAEFFGSIARRKTGCWLWEGRRNAQGYGIFGPGQAVLGTTLAHRLHWMLTFGPLPPECVVDHLCHIRNCVRLSHLEPVSRRENTRRGFGPTAINARKVVGDCGHRLTEVVKRVCLTCREAKQQCAHERKVAAKREAAAARRLAGMPLAERLESLYGGGTGPLMHKPGLRKLMNAVAKQQNILS